MGTSLYFEGVSCCTEKILAGSEQGRVTTKSGCACLAFGLVLGVIAISTIVGVVVGVLTSGGSNSSLFLNHVAGSHGHVPLDHLLHGIEMSKSFTTVPVAPPVGRRLVESDDESATELVRLHDDNG